MEVIKIINLNELFIVNYCHKNCMPLKNIFRLPKDESFLLAKEMSTNNPCTTAFYRFADFNNYYSLRIKQDEYLHNLFVSLGGKPKEMHPLSFVLQESEFLKNWFDNGYITKIPLINIPSDIISFTLGDSGNMFEKNGEVTMYTKEMLFDILNNYQGTLDEFMSEIVNKYGYIEAQLWDDTYCTN